MAVSFWFVYWIIYCYCLFVLISSRLERLKKIIYKNSLTDKPLFEVVVNWCDFFVYFCLFIIQRINLNLILAKMGNLRRVFDIGNYIKQRLLALYHRWFMTLLRRIPMDGTFDHRHPLDYLVGSNVTYYFDLKSATDRWPLPLLNTMVELLLGNLCGKTWIEVCLGFNELKGMPLHSSFKV